MKNPKISVIVSVYNTEKYIEKCLDSLLNQTYSNIEIVVINDCSTDGSLKILKKYAKKYDNMILIENKENKGLSYSRNVGLEKATGEYIGYIDSDDYVDSTYYEQMMKAIKKEKSEIAIADMKIVYEDGSFPDYVSKGCNGEVNTLNIIKNGLAASACNKLFKREIIEKYKFSEGKLNEDLAVILPSIVAAKKISYVENNNYYYVQHTGSIQNSRFSDRRFDIFYGVELTLKRIKGCKNYAKISQAIIYEQLIVLLIYVIPKEKNLIRRHHILKKYNQLSKKYNIRKNQYFWKFLEEQGRKHAIYYKILFKLNCNGLYILADLWMLMYDVLRSLLKAKNVKTDANMDDLIEKAKEQSKLNEKVSVSVVIPNYNYKRFLYQRLYSILSQKEKINEIIILDDCSTDDSRKEIDKIVAELEKYIDIKKVYNEKNSGSAFKQWEKGFSLAKSEYVWIAEADDYCSDKLLKQLVRPVVKNRDIIISYADTAFIDTVGNYLVKSIVPEIDILNTGHWNRNYVNNGKDEFNHYTYLNCTIANVSSCIIKNNNYSRFFKESGKFKQCGDWLLYANIMQLGDVAYSRQTLNYYRIHGSNVSSVTKKQAHMDEMKRVHGYFDETYGLNKKQKENINKRYKILAKAWKLK